MTTISSVIRAPEARRARRAALLVTRALFRHPSGTYVPLRAERDHTARPTLPAPPPRPALPVLPTLPAPRPHPGLAPEISHVIRLLDTSTTTTNVAIPMTGFQCLKDVRGNYVRDCWETTKRNSPTIATAPPSQQPHHRNNPHHRDSPHHETRRPRRRTRPRPRRESRTNQIRKGSFLTSPRPFHHEPRPSVSPALVSEIRIRTSA